jgi:hypothetical protein
VWVTCWLVRVEPCILVIGVIGAGCLARVLVAGLVGGMHLARAGWWRRALRGVVPGMGCSDRRLGEGCGMGGAHRLS